MSVNLDIILQIFENNFTPFRALKPNMFKNVISPFYLPLLIKNVMNRKRFYLTEETFAVQSIW